MADDLIQVTLEGTVGSIKQALGGLHGVDFGCRCSVHALPGGNTQISVFVPSGQVSALQQRGGPLSVTVTVGYNASANGRAMQAKVMRALPPGVTRLRGRGAQAAASPETITSYIDTDLLESEFQNLVTSHPNLISSVTLPHKSPQGRTMTLYRLGLQGATKTRGVLFTACAHAREWGGAEICFGLASDLLQAYQDNTGVTYGPVNYTAAQVQQILKTVDLFILPVVNPDGRIYSMTPGAQGDPMWRRNRNNPPVDLNRNYDFLWNFREDFDPAVAAGTAANEQVPPAWDDPNNGFADLYHGPSPVSEPEAKNVVWILDQFPQIGSFIDIHSYTGDFLYSWGNAPEQTSYPETNFAATAFNGKRGVPDPSVYAEYISPEDQTIVQDMANTFVTAVNSVRNSGYEARQDYWLTVAQAAGSLIYPTSGAVDDYAFSRSHGGGTKPKVYSFTLEFGRQSNFHPDWPEMGSIIDEIDVGLISFCLNPPDPCVYLEKHAADLEQQLQTLIDAFDDHEIPEPRNAKTIAGVEAEIAALRAQVVAANKAAANCRKFLPGA